MPSEKDIDEIRRKKLEELQSQQQNQDIQEEQEKQERDREEMLKHIMRKILTQDARKRLKNVELVDEEKATKVKQYLLTLAQQDKLSHKVNEEQIKKILSEVTEDKSYNIKGMRTNRD